MGPISGLLWLAGAAVAVVGWLLPGAPHDHVGLFWGLVALTVRYSVGCITRLDPVASRRASAATRWRCVSLQPLVIAALWLTGGADSYLGPVLVLPMLYVAYFFPARYAWPLAAVEIATYASPQLTSSGGHLLASRTRRLRGRLRRAGADDPVPQAAPRAGRVRSSARWPTRTR